MHGNRSLYVIQRQIVSLDLIVPLSEQHISARIGLLVHLEPHQECIDSLLPLFLHKVELCNREAGVDLHCQRNIWLCNDLLVVAQRLGIVLFGVAQKRVQIVDVSQLITIQRPLAVFGNHVIQNSRRTRIILSLSKRLCLCESLVDLVT